jgi:hypothetical protein
MAFLLDLCRTGKPYREPVNARRPAAGTGQSGPRREPRPVIPKVRPRETGEPLRDLTWQHRHQRNVRGPNTPLRFGRTDAYDTSDVAVSDDSRLAVCEHLLE